MKKLEILLFLEKKTHVLMNFDNRFLIGFIFQKTYFMKKIELHTFCEAALISKKIIWSSDGLLTFCEKDHF